MLERQATGTLKYEVQLLPVVATPAQRGGGLDQQHFTVGMLAAVNGRTELVGEQPQGSVVRCHRVEDAPRSRRPRGWDSGVTLM